MGSRGWPGRVPCLAELALLMPATLILDGDHLVQWIDVHPTTAAAPSPSRSSRPSRRPGSEDLPVGRLVARANHLKKCVRARESRTPSTSMSTFSL